jgi:hypothetical protein
MCGCNRKSFSYIRLQQQKKRQQNKKNNNVQQNNNVVPPLNIQNQSVPTVPTPNRRVNQAARARMRVLAMLNPRIAMAMRLKNKKNKLN